MEEIRNRLKKLRGSLGLNQGEFAAKMGVKQNTWSNIELGTNPCSDRYINLVCLTFNARREWLVNGTGEMFEQSQDKLPLEIVLGIDRDIPPELARLIAIYKELLPLNKEAVLEVAEATLKTQRNTIKSLQGEVDSEKRESS